MILFIWVPCLQFQLYLEVPFVFATVVGFFIYLKSFEGPNSGPKSEVELLI